jgi:hypothetical protein
MFLSFGYLILRQVLQLIVLGMRGEQAKEVEISHQEAGVRPRAWPHHEKGRRGSGGLSAKNDS